MGGERMVPPPGCQRGAADRLPFMVYQEKWIRITAGKPWFEKDDGHVIRWSVSPYSWLPDKWACIGLVSAIYIAHADTALPPCEGWKSNPHSSPREGYHPWPTLRVVS